MASRYGSMPPYASDGGGGLVIDQYRREERASANEPINRVFGPPENAGNVQSQTGTSIFDPVLCELAYTWFCPPNGKILDPFAGGSVRGIVAAYLGREYTGIELRPEQVEANRVQAEEIFGDDMGDVTIKVSGKWAGHKFPCQPDYIVANCHGRCCEGTDKIMVSLLPEEAERHKAKGFAVTDGFLQPDPVTKLCPHKLTSGLCKVHDTDMKPFGCIASPFTLNEKDTLIVRHRYSLLKCHGEGEPAYQSFRASLDLIFGETESARICAALDEGAKTITASVPRAAYDNLKYLDELKRGINRNNKKRPFWIIGDAIQAKELAPGEYDFIFSCPPYYDLEVYSDLPGELSAMPTYEEFLSAYRQIVADCISLLKDDRFACFVVGDVRDKDGFYHNFVSDTIAAFQDAGAKLYNEAILITAIGSLPIRVGRQFEAGRKLGKTHQNVLVFCKGDPRTATEACGAVDVGDLE